jgi:hypothetical protein
MNNKTRPMVLQRSLADNLGPDDDKMHDFGPKESQTQVGNICTKSNLHMNIYSTEGQLKRPLYYDGKIYHTVKH